MPYRNPGISMPPRIARRLIHIILTLAIALVPLTGCSVGDGQPQITVTALASQMQQPDPPLILDVRSAEEYATGHIPGAINIEYRQVPAQIEQLRPFAGRELVVYCEKGGRAGRAEAALLEAGFTRVSQLSGHMPAWRSAGLPIGLHS